MKTHTMWITCLLILTTIFISGCLNESTTGEGEGEKVTLRLALWDKNISGVIDKSVAAFEEKHKNVDVQVTYTPWSDYWTKTRTSLAGGSGPDVFWINAANFYNYAANGFIKNLQPFIDKDNLDTSVYISSLVELYKYKDDVYGMPHFLDSIALFYNKQMFDEAGLDYPDKTWTWETIEKVGAKLTNEEKGIYGYVAQVKPQEGYYNLIHQAGGHVLNKDKTKSGIGSPEALSAFKWMKHLMEKGISPTLQQQMETQPKQFFNSRKAAMIPLISVNAAESYKMLGDDLGVAPLPAGKEEATVVHGLSWVVNENTKTAQLAYELAKQLTSKQANLNIAKSGFSIPAWKGTEDEWLKSFPGIDLQVFIDSLKFGFPSPVSKNTSEWSAVLSRELQEAFLGKQSLKEATQIIEREMNKILANEQK
jgi:multiple sugar transport system substrate-binding protein